MTIERNGQKIELTSEEVRNACEEYLRECRKEDIRSVIEQNPDLNAKDFDLDCVVEKLDRCLSKNDSYYEAYWLSVDDAIDMCR